MNPRVGLSLKSGVEPTFDNPAPLWLLSSLYNMVRHHIIYYINVIVKDFNKS